MSNSALVDNNKKLHPYTDKGKYLVKSSHLESFPAHVNEFEGFRRQGPRTSITTGSTITDGQLIDIYLEGEQGGFTNRIFCELRLKELGNADDATVSTELVFQRIEVYANGNKELFHTIYPDELGHLQFLDLPFEQLRKIRGGLAIGSDYIPVTDNLAQNGVKTYYIEIPLFKGAPFDIRNVKGGILFKFIFNAPSVFCNNAGSTNVVYKISI